MRKSLWAIPLILLLVMTSFGCASNKGANSILQPTLEKVLPNGLTLIVKEVHSAPLVSIHFVCKTGSVNEPTALNGISHFYEHMFFKGTKRYPRGEMDKLIKSLGGYNNASTGLEQTDYHVVLPAENFNQGIDVLYDALVNSVFDPIEVAAECKVVQEEIRRREDNPQGKLSEIFQQTIFLGTPYAQPVLGPAETISTFQSADFRNYLACYYYPGNMAMIVVGDVRAKQVLDRVQALTAQWHKSASTLVKPPAVIVKTPEAVRMQSINKDVEKLYFTLGFTYPGYADFHETVVLDVATTILGSGNSSRLNQLLREQKNLVSGIGAWVWPLQSGGVIGFDGSCQVEQWDTVRTLLLESIRNMVYKGVVEDELRKAKNLLIVGFETSNESANSIAYTLGSAWESGHFQQIIDYPALVEQVTKEDVQKVLKKYVMEDNYVVAVLGKI